MAVKEFVRSPSHHYGALEHVTALNCCQNLQPNNRTNFPTNCCYYPELLSRFKKSLSRPPNKKPFLKAFVNTERKNLEWPILVESKTLHVRVIRNMGPLRALLGTKCTPYLEARENARSGVKGLSCNHYCVI